MGSQKIPLFNGIIKGVGDVAPAPVVDLFTPPDKNLLAGSQAFYEVHMWVIPSGIADVYSVSAVEDGNPASEIPIWIGNEAVAGPLQAGLPIKVLDGYPVRGNVTIKGAFATSALNAVHVYGYYYRVGQGEVIQPARRFIGAALNAFNAGVPIKLVAGEKRIIHTFQKERIDEISLALQMSDVTEGSPVPLAVLGFEDASGVPLDTPTVISVQNVPDYRRNPASPYNFFQVPFGGSPALPTLVNLALTSNAAPNPDFYVHGYFTRR